MNGSAALPGYLRFAWMLFLQPVSLHRLLLARGVEEPEERGWRIFLAPGADRLTRRRYLYRLLVAPLLGTPPLAGMLALVLLAMDYRIDWLQAVVGTAVAVAVGVGLSLLLGMRGLALGSAVVAAIAVLASVADGSASAMAGGLVVGLAVGLSLQVDLGVIRGEAGTLAGGLVLAVVLAAALGVAIEVARGDAFGLSNTKAFGMSPGVAFAIAFAIAFVIADFRLLFWPLEALAQTLAYGVRHRLGPGSLGLSPVLWHDLSYLPLPFLGRHIESVAAFNVELVQRALDHCGIAPGQRVLARNILARLQARELRQVATEGYFQRFQSGRTIWIMGDPAVHRFLEVARLLVAADGSNFVHHRLAHLESAANGLSELSRQLAISRARGEAWLLQLALPAWRAAVDQRVQLALREVKGLLPVPFRAGEPLDPERGREVFRGREASIREIEEHLALAQDARSVALLGPRRTGKSSLLRMLPAMLPDAVCIFFDLQGHPVETPEGFFRALAEETRRQARRSRRLELPELPPGPPFEAAAAWIQSLEDNLGERRLLICFDEFEALEHSFRGEREDLKRLMGLLRATIQHRRQVRLLVAGEAPFDELDTLWDSHFVSVREVRLGHLAPEVAIDLVRRPIPSFPEDAIPEEVARSLVERTGAQPFLVQLFAQMLVTRLNEEKRKSATWEDLAAVEEKALGQVGSYFRDLWNRAPENAKEVLAALAREEKPEIPKSARRWLDRRCLLDREDRLAIPVFGRFLVEEVLD